MAPVFESAFYFFGLNGPRPTTKMLQLKLLAGLNISDIASREVMLIPAAPKNLYRIPSGGQKSPHTSCPSREHLFPKPAGIQQIDRTNTEQTCNMTGFLHSGFILLDGPVKNISKDGQLKVQQGSHQKSTRRTTECRCTSPVTDCATAYVFAIRQEHDKMIGLIGPLRPLTYL